MLLSAGGIEQQHNTALSLRRNLVCLSNSFWHLCSAKLFLLFCSPRGQPASCGSHPASPSERCSFGQEHVLSLCFVNTLPQDLLGHAAQNIISASSPHADFKKARLVFELLVFALSPTGVQKVFGPSPLSICSFFERAASSWNATRVNQASSWEFLDNRVWHHRAKPSTLSK